jgi:2',3'-cyclic-nucleotide 2'-phosphodiesterase (5'-nucleotidase family)
MVIVELTGAELLATMKNAVSRVPALDGRFPQVAGITLEYDASLEGVSDQASLESASRIQNMTVTRADGTEVTLVEDGEVVGDLSQTFKVVTNSFLLTGGDGYQAFLSTAEARGAENPGVGERQILIDYITEELGGEVDITIEDSRVERLDATQEETTE